jgi:NADPH-dependent glutamate synthase beta subunit-like oxidoreductase
MSTSSVYDIHRIEPGPTPEGFHEDLDDINFVPAPCQVACPIGTDAPSYIAYIWEGKVEQAFEAITATNPFSSICGRVCDAPCEPACRRTDSDGPIAIRNLKRYVMDKLGKTYRLPAVEVTRRQTIGIVGSGPAGLTAAQDLAEAGYEVHVYEMTDRLGGMMVWGIPAFRLPPGIIEEDIERMLGHCPGIKVHLNTALGRDVALDELKRRHDAVLLTIGSWWGKSMDIPGCNDPRVVDGVGFLRKVNAGERPTLPETVIVVGGGDVAMDACRAARRLPGCKTVKVVYRRGPKEIPARKDELDGALKEGIEFLYNTQPVAALDSDHGFALRCVVTQLGAPGQDGRRVSENIPGSEHDLACGMVIMAVGQQAESRELAERGLMNGDRVRTQWDTMRTEDPKVFAAGDGAFGGSTIVMAMMHGHRAAYYVQAFLEGREDPVPYRTPYRTRRVAVAQDPDWEVINRQHQPFHGLGRDPVQFPEIESTYDTAAARAEAARCYRCDAETGTANYDVRTREDIFVMARTNPLDAATQGAMLKKRLLPRPNPFPAERPATLDDLIFLPANLSRLVIDPYRDHCTVSVELAGRLKLDLPYLVSGFDESPAQVREAVEHGVSQTGVAYLGRSRVDASTRWIQLAIAGVDRPDPGAAGVIYVCGNGFAPFELRKARPEQMVGLVAGSADLAAAIPFALDQRMDLLLLSAMGPLTRSWSELHGQPDFPVLRDAVRLLRRMNREEDIDLLYFGGVRSGTDVAKLVALGCKAVVVAAGMAFAAGGVVQGDTLQFYSDVGDEERRDRAASYLRALREECSIMARCTGKTSVQNLEPEDVRAITITTSRATGVPLVGLNKVPEAA